MAFQKTTALYSGASGNYARISYFRWNRTQRELQCGYSLWLDETTANTDGAVPLSEEFARFKISGDQYDDLMDAAAIATAAASEIDMLSLIYSCTKDACNQYITDSNTIDPFRFLVCDLGADYFHDATDV